MKNRRLSTIILIFCLVVLGLNARRFIFQYYYCGGVLAINKDNYPLGLSLLRKGLDFEPDSQKIKEALSTGLNNYALSLRAEEKEKAIRLLEEAVLISPEQELFRKNLASLYNDLGIMTGRQNNFDEAIKNLQKALEIEPANKIYQYHLGNLLKIQGYSYFEKDEFNIAIDFLNDALQYLPSDTTILRLLGEAYYKIDDFEEAMNHWEEALRILPADTGLKKNLAKVIREWSVQKNFEEFHSKYFKISFSPALSRDKAYAVYNSVKEAVWTVGKDLRFYPAKQVSVFVYPREEFEKIFQPHKHLVGLFDGKIRLSINDDTGPEKISELVRHEYTHVVLFELTKEKIPVWLNEGLARFEEKRNQPVDFTELKNLARQKKLIPFYKLSEIFSNLENFDQAHLAYMQVHSLVKYIIDEYGMWMVRKMIELFNQGKTEREVIKEVLRIEPEQLEKEWRKKLINE